MILILSDLHLADTAERRTVDVIALCQMIANTAKEHFQTQDAELEILFLGDIFEVLKSSIWTDLNLRPWDVPSSSHCDAVTAIFARIVACNSTFFRELDALAFKYPGLTCRYVPGNHDWPLNADIGRGARKLLVQSLKLNHDPERAFSPVYLNSEHRLMASHGHEHDPFNRTEPGRIGFGDAMVIEVLLMLPKLVAARLGGLSEFDKRLAFLHELDNVRPQSGPAMASWLSRGAKLLEAEMPGAVVAVRESVARVINQMRTLRKRRNASGAWRRGNSWMGALAKISDIAATRVNIIDLVSRWTPGLESSTYSNAAEVGRSSIAHSQDRFKPDYVVCGHTHLPEHLALRHSSAEDLSPTLYLNTGTWRRVQRYAVDVEKQPYFVTYNEECYVVVHNQKERLAGAPGYEFRRVVRG